VETDRCEASKRCFFKKAAKTLAMRHTRCADDEVLIIKSFLVLFFKKEPPSVRCIG
jgi:hypothetical protein